MSFEHLDDPAGFVPDDEFRAAVRQGGRRLRTRRRLALAGGSVLTGMAVLLASVAGYALWRTSQIDRVDVDFAAPPVDLTAPFNVLLIGSDSRAGTSDADLVAGARSDTMMVARIEPAERRIVLLSLPRDLAVAPVGGGAPVRLNTAFSEGGAAALVATVESRLGVPLSAFVEVDFQGLVDLVDAVGGLPVAVSATVRDEQTGLALTPAACADLDGRTALALLRSRHLQYLDDGGRWVDDPSSDLGRMTRQRAVIAALLPELGGLTDGLGGLERAVELAASDLTIDGRLDLGTLVAVGRWATDGPAPSIDQVVVPVEAGQEVGGASVLTLAEGASAAVARVGGELPTDATASGSAGIVPVEGSAVAGAVGEVPIGPCA